MSDWIAASVNIGGPVKRRVLPKLLSYIESAGVGLEWGSRDFRPRNEQDILDAVRRSECGWLTLRDDEARGGKFEELEASLLRIRIGYNRYTEAKYEYDGEFVAYRPSMRKPASFTASQNGGILVSASDLEKVIHELKNQKIQNVLETLEKLCGANIQPLASLRFTD